MLSRQTSGLALPHSFTSAAALTTAPQLARWQLAVQTSYAARASDTVCTIAPTHQADRARTRSKALSIDRLDVQFIQFQLIPWHGQPEACGSSRCEH